MARAKKTRATSKSKTPAARKKASTGSRKAATARGRKAPANRAQPVGARLKKAKKYSLRSRYATFRVGDRVSFDRIQNWEQETDIENVTGTVIDKIYDRENELKFIEVQFELDDEYIPGEKSLRVRRFVVK